MYFCAPGLSKPFIPTNNNTCQFKVTSSPVIKHSAIKMTVELTEETIVRVSIYDIMGREVKGMKQKLSMGINTLDIDTDTPLSGGVYFAVMEYDNQIYKEKFIIVK